MLKVSNHFCVLFASLPGSRGPRAQGLARDPDVPIRTGVARALEVSWTSVLGPGGAWWAIPTCVSWTSMSSGWRGVPRQEVMGLFSLLSSRCCWALSVLV